MTSTCHPHVICMSSAHHLHLRMLSACHPHTCLSCPISCSTTPGVMHLLSADTHIICTSSPHVDDICMSSAHTHVICTSSTHLPELPNFMQYYTSCHAHVICRYAHCPHVIHTSSPDAYVRCTHHLQQSLWTPIVFPVPKILVIDVTVVPDVIPDVALLKIYCLHIIPGCPCGPHGPKLCFLSQR